MVGNISGIKTKSCLVDLDSLLEIRILPVISALTPRVGKHTILALPSKDYNRFPILGVNRPVLTYIGPILQYEGHRELMWISSNSHDNVGIGTRT